MRHLALAAVAAAVLASGCIGSQSVKGVKVYDAVEIGKDSGLGAGKCVAKVRNTNSYYVNLTYRFEGTGTEEVRVKPVESMGEEDLGFQIINGMGCSKPEVEILSVERVNPP